MLYFFTDPYEDEIFYNTVVRYNRYSGNISDRRTGEDLFGTRPRNHFGNFPCYLQYFSDQFKRKSIYTPEYIIGNHTIFPLYKPFLNENRVHQIIDGMKNNNPTSINARIGELAGGICKDFGIRICLKCIDEDQDKYGEWYVHREHQSPGNQICYAHGEILKRLKLPKYTGELEYIDYNRCEIEYNNDIVDESNIEYFKNLSDDIHKILMLQNNEINIKNLIKKYRVKLMQKGLASITGIINWTKVEKEFLQFYPLSFLDKLESNLETNESFKWIKMLAKEENLTHPIRHLLFIRFLFGSIEELIAFKELEFKPFGDGPWPCLNPACEYYKQDVIMDVEISTRSKPTEPLGIFTCSCGYSYTRQATKNDLNDKYKKRMVKSYGPVWMKCLKNNIEKQIYNISQLERIMGCDSKTIGKYAKELEVFHLLNSRMVTDSVKDRTEARYDSSLEELYKADIMKFIEENPNASRSKIMKTLQKQCTWVYRYRREWFESIMPKQIDKHVDSRKVKVYVDWKQRDDELSKSIEEIINDIKQKEPNKKITISLLRKIVRFKFIDHLEKLPKTKLVLKECNIIYI